MFPSLLARGGDCQKELHIELPRMGHLLVKVWQRDRSGWGGPTTPDREEVSKKQFKRMSCWGCCPCRSESDPGARNPAKKTFKRKVPAGPKTWLIDFYPMLVLGRSVLSLRGSQTPAQYWIKIVHPQVQKFYPVLGLRSVRSLLRHFQPPVLYSKKISVCENK